MKATTSKDPEGFTKVGGKGKGGKQYQKKINEYGQSCHNSFKILEEEVEINETNQESENIHTEKESDTNMEEISENSKQKDDMLRNMELSSDHEMTPSEAGMEDHEL